jgi:hypothetical protein
MVDRTVAPTKQILMSDMFTAFNHVDLRALKTLRLTPVQSGVLQGFSYAYNVERVLSAGETVAINFTVFASSFVKIPSSTIFPVMFYGSHSAGTASDILQGINLNCESVDQTPTQAQIIESATVPSDLILCADAGEVDILFCDGSEISAAIKNTSAEDVSVCLSIVVTEIGPRSPAVGLTPSTELFPDTEMSTFG